MATESETVDANGLDLDWSPSGGTNYTCIDELLAVANTADYVWTNGAGTDAKDEFSVTPPTLEGTGVVSSIRVGLHCYDEHILANDIYIRIFDGVAQIGGDKTIKPGLTYSDKWTTSWTGLSGLAAEYADFNVHFGVLQDYYDHFVAAIEIEFTYEVPSGPENIAQVGDTDAEDIGQINDTDWGDVDEVNDVS